jgi:hypothetical protein
MSGEIVNLPRAARVVVNRGTVTVDRATFISLLDLMSDLVAARQQFAPDDLLTTISHLCCFVSDLIDEGRGR